MATLKEQLQKAKNLTSQNISDELFNFIKTIQEKFTELNKEQLFETSEDIFGDPIGYYSRATEYITTNNALLGYGGEIKKEGEPYNLRETGAFLKGLFIDVKNGSIYFGSKDSKTELILSNENLLSKNLFGLQEENLRELIDKDLLPFVLKHVRKFLHV